jgi:hypothetical protein
MKRDGHDTLKDVLQVGAMFGGMAWAAVFVLLMGWTLVSRTGSSPVPMDSTALVHAINLGPYLIIGCSIGCLWPIRKKRGGPCLLWILASVAVGLSIFSLAYGGAWTWTLLQWAKFGVAVTLFPFIVCWPRTRKA